MVEFNEVKVSRILNPTSIDLGEYVINPYMGCEFACLYCYVRFNKVISRKTKPWGSYVDIRVNAPYLLEKEILARKPKTVLLGSTTECFQPIESKYKITKNILEVLNRYNIYYVILTRSPYITEYLELLHKGYCKMIYFTINNVPQELKNTLEPKSAPYAKRIEAIFALSEAGIPVTPYFSPIFPYVSDVTGGFSLFPKIPSIEFEGLNFRVVNIDRIIKALTGFRPELTDKYSRLIKNKSFYEEYWNCVRDTISREAKKTKKQYNIYIHNSGDYFKNIYSPQLSDENLI